MGHYCYTIGSSWNYFSWREGGAKENLAHYCTDNFQVLGTFSQEKATFTNLWDLEMPAGSFWFWHWDGQSLEQMGRYTMIILFVISSIII